MGGIQCICYHEQEGCSRLFRQKLLGTNIAPFDTMKAACFTPSSQVVFRSGGPLKLPIAGPIFVVVRQSLQTEITKPFLAPYVSSLEIRRCIRIL